MANLEVLVTIILYNFLLIAIGFWAKKRTNNQDDFYLGSRGLGPLVMALSASASSSSAWSLLGVNYLKSCYSDNFLSVNNSGNRL